MTITLDKSIGQGLQIPKVELTVRQWRTLLRKGKVKVGERTYTHEDGPFRVKKEK